MIQCILLMALIGPGIFYAVLLIGFRTHVDKTIDIREPEERLSVYILKQNFRECWNRFFAEEEI